MRKYYLLLFALLIATTYTQAQIQVAKFLGENKDDYTLGFGGFLKFSYPILSSADLTLEGGANFFFEKNNTDYGVADIPVKLGFRYLLSRSGSGFYVEPQLGYNFVGVNRNDEKFTGPVAAGIAGYLFPNTGGIQFDLGIIYEKAFNTGAGSFEFVGLRLTHNFSFKRRNNE